MKYLLFFFPLQIFSFCGFSSFTYSGIDIPNLINTGVFLGGADINVFFFKENYEFSTVLLIPIYT